MSRGVLATAVFLVTLLVQSPALRGEFLFYDDARFVVRNEAIEDLGNTPRFFHDLATTASSDAPTEDIYRPLRTFTYALIANVYGKQPAGFHFVALLFHAGAAGLLVFLLLRAGCSLPGAALGALAWGLHPVTVEVTAWISSLGDAICGFFVVVSMLAYDARRTGWALAALVVALLGKEAAIVVPGLWLAWDYFLRRDEWKGRAGRAVAPALGIVLLFLVVRGVVVGAGMSQQSEPLYGSFGNAVRTMLAGYGFYLSTIFFPFGSTVDTRIAAQTSWFGAPLVGLLLLGATIAAVFRGPTRTRLAAAWFLLALVPYSNILVTLKIPTADRFLYLPLMAIGLVVGELVARAPRIGVRVAPFALIALAALTVRRIGDWHDDASFLAAWRRVNPKSFELLWAEASFHAKESVEAMQGGNGHKAQFHYSEANRLYGQFQANVQGKGATPIQIWMEAGDLSYAYGRFLDSLGRTREARQSASFAFTWYRIAFEQQRRGIGRVIEEEVLHAADRIAELSTRLADMANPEMMRTIQEGMRALQFLNREYNVDIDLRFARLLFAAAVRIRVEQPDDARRMFSQVLAAVQQQEEKGATGLSFLKAQALYYRGFLRPYDRDSVRASFELYRQSASEPGGDRYLSMIFAARAKCSEGREFKDPEALETGRKLLESIEAIAKKEGVKLPESMLRKIQSELATCVSRD
ncbi:MAG: hypothetical protein AAGD14_14415 [Planctomycetota bacterium]